MKICRVYKSHFPNACLIKKLALLTIGKNWWQPKKLKIFLFIPMLLSCIILTVNYIDPSLTILQVTAHSQIRLLTSWKLWLRSLGKLMSSSMWSVLNASELYRSVRYQVPLPIIIDCRAVVSVCLSVHSYPKNQQILGIHGLLGILAISLKFVARNVHYQSMVLLVSVVWQHMQSISLWFL